ncbi:MAG: hypothetical protein CM15mP74_10560 [Halieaceae bacterium]|nr:MAG: hypothetical protein CM15mP74_10560 [Halieaceae bacterium]
MFALASRLLAGGYCMVTSVTSFSRTGLSDWLIQRVTSLVLLAYFLLIAYQLTVQLTTLHGERCSTRRG